jgi:DNA invertase Pin-like site-specific DNA recombinase
VKTAAGPALAYSYLRFSSPAQADGDSVDRQTRLRKAWLQRHPEVRLDQSLTLVDAGVSGYRGEHRTNRKHALASFLDQVERGRVPIGSFLIVENLDRLTRENPVVSIPAVLNLIAAGVRVVQLAPVELVYDAEMEQHHLMNMLWELSRGHAESRRKSGMCGEAWHEKKEQARAEKTPYGKMCPAWLELVDGRWRVKQDAARAVRKIFQWCAGGLGTFGILERLNAEGIPSIGRTGRWERSYVRKILTSVAVRGIYQPHNGSRGPNRRPDGEPVADYYPRVIAEDLWHAAQQASRRRQRKTGRPSPVFNPFSGLLYSGTDGSKLHVCGAHGGKYLVSSAAVQKTPGLRWCTFPLAPFVEVVLSNLRELSAAELFCDPSAVKVTELEGRLEEVEKKLAVAVARFDADPESPTWAERVSKYDREKRSLTKELAEARATAHQPLSATWSETVRLMAKKDPERLRAGLLATISGIWCVFVGRGRTRLCACQVHFKEGSHRDYLLANQKALGGMVPSEPARCVGRSLHDVLKPGDLDLRQVKDAARLEKALQAIDIEKLVGVLDQRAAATK